MKALYRKYRPKTLSEVVGQEKITEILEKSIENDNISHAYLFTGPRGTGKTSVARIFAHEINHFPYELEDSYVDIIEIDAASNTGVDNIRDLKERALIAPTKGKYKVYIIDEVHMLSKSAFNALLKILEEPPKHIVFILATTDLQKVPITITSRVQKHTFRLADKDIMQSYLKKICEKENIKISEDGISLITKRGGGSFRDSLSLLDQISNLGEKEITKEIIEKSLGLPNDEQIKLLLKLYSDNNLTEISKTLKETLNSGIKPETLSEELINQILENPKPELLPLLSKLVEVKSPFSVAKLLLALLNSNQPAKPQKQILTQTIPKPQFKKPNEDIITSEKENEEVTEEPKEFTWENFKESVGKKSNGLKLQLEKCNYKVENDTLHIFPTNSASKLILSSPRNSDVLKRSLKNLDLQIHSLDERNIENKDDTRFEKINDIMGKTQEVNNGEVPF